MRKRIALMTYISLIMVSCSKDFIELDPISSVNVDVLYKTDKDFSDALTAAYNTIQTQYQDFWIFGDIRADDTYQEIYKGNSWTFADTFAITSSDGLMDSTWQNYYQTIYRVNTILANIENVDESVVTNKKRYVAEAKFIRALAYFDLVRIFGDVPKIIAPLSTEEAYNTGREMVDNIYNEVIIPDFLDAENNLPQTYSGADVGRPTMGAAKALLGRVYLTLGDFLKAETKLQEVTTLGYSLLPNYNDLFDYTNEHHSEYIFDIEYEEGIGEGSIFTNGFLPNYAPMVAYYNIGGTGNEQNSPTQALIDLFDSNDLRKNITVGVQGGYYDNDSIFHELPTNTSQTYTKKYITPVAASNDSKANWKVIRYADVLLMYAEALNENGKTAEAIPYMNQVRTRAGLAGYPTTLTQSETRDAIALERRLELSFEGVRWFDLLRTGRAYDVMQDEGMLPYMTVFPLPLSQIQLMNDPSIFPQNEGYN